jgi:hypothetical protein
MTISKIFDNNNKNRNCEPECPQTKLRGIWETIIALAICNWIALAAGLVLLLYYVLFN